MNSGELSPAAAKKLAYDAYVYGFAMVENYKTFYGMCIWEDSPQFSGFNNYLHGRELYGPDFELVVNANNDTLYSTTFLDLGPEPRVVTVPPTGDRYFVIQLVDMGTDNFAYIGTRTTGTDGGEFLFLGPSFNGVVPDGEFTAVIKAPSRFVALATRTAINGQDDLDGVVVVQEGLRIAALSEFLGTEAGEAIPVEFPAFSKDVYGSPNLLPLLNFLLPFHTLPDYEQELVKQLDPIDVGPFRTFDIDAYSEDVRNAIREGVKDAHAAIEEKGNNLGKVVEGWQEIPPMGSFGDDFLFRSAVAWKFIYTNSPEEAIYPIAETDADGKPLSGKHGYVLHFPPGQLPPVGAFWSITLYDSVTRLMIHNPIARYSIGDRTPGLVYGDDGSLTIYIQHVTPGLERESNWLPSPVGRFYLNVRAYMPEPEFIDGTYRLPAVRRVN
ncbi:MAG: DUF1254 domain-containing protein [Thermomicrobiales bacterium]|nr:DUF1254 domain-containing protein [Thermomicrobiales bacterium]